MQSQGSPLGDPYFWHWLQSLGVPEISVGFDNLLEALTLLIGMVFYMEGILIKLSQGKRPREQHPEKFHKQSFQLCSPGTVRDIANFPQ